MISTLKIKKMMMHKKHVFVIGAIIFAFFLFSCQPARILYTSSQLKTLVEDTFNIKRVRKVFWSNSVIVKSTKGKKSMLASEKVWGIQYKNGVAYRYYHGRFYLIKASDTLVIYYVYHGGHHSYHKHDFFSKNLDSPIYTLDKYNLTEQFAENKCFLEKINQLAKELKWYQTYAIFNRDKGTYQIVELYKQCK